MQLRIAKLTLNDFTHSSQSTFSLRFLSSPPGIGKLLILHLYAAFFQKSVVLAEEVWGDYVNNNYDIYIYIYIYKAEAKLFLVKRVLFKKWCESGSFCPTHPSRSAV